MLRKNSQTIVPCRPLKSIFHEYDITHIHFFSLDVEGYEFEVLNTINFNKVRIDVLLVEIDGMGQLAGKQTNEKNLKIDKLLTQKAGMIKMPTDGNLVPECQRNKKNRSPNQLTIWHSNLYVHPSMRDDICT